MTFDFHVFSCDEPEGAPACPYTIFDVIVQDPDAVSTDYLVLRTGRCGTSLIIVGLYLMRVSLQILIPDKSDIT